MITKQDRYQYRKARTRRNIMVAANPRPRLAVYRSLRYLYAQIVDDATGRTLAYASTLSKDFRDKYGNCAKKVDAAKALGGLIAKKALDAGVKEVCFDRAGRIYHGKVKAIADGAREAGLKF
ncbi:MAG: 50S ribosomal protein L18 [Elusimicrobiales bacterium]|nr:50S ribosomal protein L18 [Elusimicrobiales bacterium]